MPVKVDIPDSLGLKRDLRSPVRHTDNNPLDETDLAQYDSQTLLYDVFFNVENDCLYLLGPPLLNLRRQLLPLTIRLNGVEIRASEKEYFKQRFVQITAAVNPTAIKPTNRVELDFNGVFTVELEVERNQQPRYSRILTTLQKNNRPKWIKEWVQYYRENYAIDAVVLYDNGSDDVETLRAEMDGVIIENWDYPFGVVNSHFNKFCQYGSLNHCRLKYGSGSVIFNFDIDEILCTEATWLNDQIKQFDVLMFDSYQVPNQNLDSPDYSFGSFAKRNRVNKDKVKKYIYRDSAVVANNAHFVQTVENETLYKIHKELMRLFRKMKKKRSLTRLATYISEFISGTREAKLDEGYFLHYSGITTNWKAHYYNRLNVDINDDDVVDIDPAYLAKIRSISITGPGQSNQD